MSVQQLHSMESLTKKDIASHVHSQPIKDEEKSKPIEQSGNPEAKS